MFFTKGLFICDVCYRVLNLDPRFLSLFPPSPPPQPSSFGLITPFPLDTVNWYRYTAQKRCFGITLKNFDKKVCSYDNVKNICISHKYFKTDRKANGYYSGQLLWKAIYYTSSVSITELQINYKKKFHTGSSVIDAKKMSKNFT